MTAPFTLRGNQPRKMCLAVEETRPENNDVRLFFCCKKWIAQVSSIIWSKLTYNIGYLAKQVSVRGVWHSAHIRHSGCIRAELEPWLERRKIIWGRRYVIQFERKSDAKFGNKIYPKLCQVFSCVSYLDESSRQEGYDSVLVVLKTWWLKKWKWKHR